MLRHRAPTRRVYGEISVHYKYNLKSRYTPGMCGDVPQSDEIRWSPNGMDVFKMSVGDETKQVAIAIYGQVEK